MISATANLIGTITATAVIFSTQTGGCSDATVENSDATFTHDIASGATYVLADTTFNFYVNGVLDQTATVASMVNQTFNIQ